MGVIVGLSCSIASVWAAGGSRPALDRNLVELIEGQSAEEKARVEIKQLLGDLIFLAPGSYLDPETQQVEITRTLLMPEVDLTQGRYDLIAKANSSVLLPSTGIMKSVWSPYDPVAVAPNKPMGGLRYREWNSYLLALNEKLKELWLIAYPSLPIPTAVRPFLKELRYAMTTPVDEEKVLSDGRTVQITGRLSQYSGPSDQAPRAEIRKYHVFGQWDTFWNGNPSVDVGTELTT